MARKYHMLFTREDEASSWGPQFGDYDLATVRSEMGDGYSEYAKGNIVILTLPSDSQAEVDNAVRALNKHGTRIRL